jgi:hypothetical protein
MDFDHGMAIVGPYRDGNGAGRVTELKRIIEEVPDNALKLAFITIRTSGGERAEIYGLEAKLYFKTVNFCQNLPCSSSMK